MKRGTPNHPKLFALSKKLRIPHAHAVGILELLFHYTSKYAIRGNIGKWNDAAIAEAVGWTKKPDELIAALVEFGWLDRHPEYRLVVHDWEDHADGSVRKTLKNRGEDFCEPVREHLIYFILAPNSGRIKIGSSSRPMMFRMAELRALSPEAIELVGTLPGSFAMEDAIHERFKAYRQHGEWFDYSDEIKSWLLSIKELHKDFPEKEEKSQEKVNPPFLSYPKPEPKPVLSTPEPGCSTSEIPSLEEVLKEADMRGILKQTAEGFFNYHQGNNTWFNQYNRLINWRDKLRTWATNERSKGGKVNGESVPPDWKQIQILEECISSHIANKESTSYNHNCTQSDRDDLKEKRRILRDLKEASVNSIVNHAHQAIQKRSAA